MGPKRTPQTLTDLNPTCKEDSLVTREDVDIPDISSLVVTDTKEEELSGYSYTSSRELKISNAIEKILKSDEMLKGAELTAQIEAIADEADRNSVAQELEKYLKQIQLQKQYLETPSQQGRADTEEVRGAFEGNKAQIAQLNIILSALDKNADQRSRALEGIFRESLGLRQHLQVLLESPQDREFQGFSLPAVPFEISSESEYELLDTDHTSGEDEVLGESFNLPYKDKFVPGNRIHKQLAWYQNHYREKFYEVDNGTPRYGTKPFPKFYGEKKQGILKAQAVFKEEVGTIRRVIDRSDPTSVKEYHARKQAGLKKSIGHHYITTLKEVPGSNKVYPNFATAKLSYVTHDKVYSKFIVIPRGDEEGALDGHSEKQIFQQTKKDILANSKYLSADLVVLDINTAMSMCESGDNCHQEADRFIQDMYGFIEKDKLKVRISYNFRYNERGDPLRGDEQNLFQKQIALPGSPALSHTVKVKSIVISSGYQASRQHTQSIQKADKFFDSEIAEYATEYAARLRNSLLAETTIDFTGGLEFLLLEALGLYNKYDELAWEAIADDGVRKVGRIVPEGFTDVNDNGHCFYHAIALQLSNVINPPSSAQLQAMAINHIVNYPGWYHAFLIGFAQEIPGIAQFVQDENYARALEVYINYHLRNNDGHAPAWADNLMMGALSNALGVNFNSYLFNVDGSPQLNEDGSQKMIPIIPYTGQSQHTLRVGNLGNIHFVSQDLSVLPHGTLVPSLLGTKNFDGLPAASGPETDQIDELEGEPSIEVIQRLDQQGHTWMEKGNYARALPCYQKALKMRMSMNSSPLGIAVSHNGIGHSYLKQGNYKQALDSFYRALDIHRSIGTPHKDLYADCLDNVGLACRHNGEYRKAFEFHQQALSIRQDLYKKPHPSKAKSLNNIGLVYKLLGQYEEALGSYQGALGIWETLYNHKPNTHTATSLNNIASVYVKQKKYGEALEPCEKALKMRLYIYQENPHLDLAQSYSTIANIYGYSGDYDAEITNQLEALAIMGRILKGPHKDIATSCNNIGVAFYSKGNIDEALGYYVQALEMRKALHPGQDHKDIVESLYNIGLVYEAVGDHDNALDFHKQALEMRKRIYEEHSNLERLHDVADHDDQAPKMRKRTYESHPDQKNIAKSYEKVASIYAAKGNREQALQNYVEALKILKATNSNPLEIERIELFSSAFKTDGAELVDSLFELGSNEETAQEPQSPAQFVFLGQNIVMSAMIGANFIGDVRYICSNMYPEECKRYVPATIINNAHVVQVGLATLARGMTIFTLEHKVAASALFFVSLLIDLTEHSYIKPQLQLYLNDDPFINSIADYATKAGPYVAYDLVCGLITNSPLVFINPVVYGVIVASQGITSSISHYNAFNFYTSSEEGRDFANQVVITAVIGAMTATGIVAMSSSLPLTALGITALSSWNLAKIAHQVILLSYNTQSLSDSDSLFNMHNEYTDNHHLEVRGENVDGSYNVLISVLVKPISKAVREYTEFTVGVIMSTWNYMCGKMEIVESLQLILSHTFRKVSKWLFGDIEDCLHINEIVHNSSNDKVIFIDTNKAGIISNCLEHGNSITVKSDKDIIIESYIKWVNMSNSLTFISQGNIILLEQVFFDCASNLTLKAGIENRNGEGEILFEGDIQVYMRNDATVKFYYNLKKNDKNCKYHNPNAYFLHTEPMAAEVSYMLINNIYDLADVVCFMKGNYALSQDIDATDTKNWNNGKGFEPLFHEDGNMSFYGYFNGQGYSIKNLYIARPEEDNVGLFRKAIGYDRENPIIIENLVFENLYVEGRYTVGAVAADSQYVTMSNISIYDSTVIGKTLGIVGTISNTELREVLYKNVTLNSTAQNFCKLTGVNIESSIIVPTGESCEDCAGYINFN